MYKLVVIYRRVKEQALLETFFQETHLPLAEQLPNLNGIEVSHITSKPGGQSRFHMMVEHYFDDDPALKMAFASDTGVALISALKPWGENKLITWYFADSYYEEYGAASESES